MIFDFLKPKWKREFEKGYHHKAFEMFKDRHPALVAHHAAQREFELVTGLKLKRRSPKPATIPEPIDIHGENPDLGMPEEL